MSASCVKRSEVYTSNYDANSAASSVNASEPCVSMFTFAECNGLEEPKEFVFGASRNTYSKLLLFAEGYWLRESMS